MKSRSLPTVVLALIVVGSEALFSQTGWEELAVLRGRSVWASSTLEEVLEERRVRYDAESLFDGDPGTCWVEGAPGDGVGESVTFVVDRAVGSLTLVNGFARSQRLFWRNARLKAARVSLLAGFTAPGLISETDAELYFLRPVGAPQVLEIADTTEPQVFHARADSVAQARGIREALGRFLADFPDFARMMAAELGFEDPGTLRGERREEFLDLALAAFGKVCLRLQIVEVYPGSHYTDTCLSEIVVDLE